MGEYKKKQNGLILAASSSFVFAVCSLIAKYLTDFHPTQLSFCGFFCILFVSGIHVLRGRERVIPRGVYKLVLLRSVCGCVFFISSFYAVQVMPLGDASVLFYTAPVWTLILARWFLNEPCSLCNALIVVIVMIGVVLVTQPPVLFNGEDNTKSEHYVKGACAALLASFSEAVGNIALRELKNVPSSVILFNYGFVSSLISGSSSVAFGTWTSHFPTYQDFSLIAMLSFLTLLEQYLMTLALSLEHAGPVALIQASDIIYGYIFEVLFYGEEVNFCSFLGALIVGVVVVYMAVRTSSNSHTSVV